MIHVYSGGRPRWAAQLCRLAGKEAISVGSSVIKFGHIKQVLEGYGRFRLDDVTREHRHQCEVISEIVNAFAKQQSHYSTSQLCAFIERRVLPNIKVQIDGVDVADAVVVARFLFRIGFILGVDRDDGDPDYYSFEEKPELLKNRANIDDGMRWLVHQSYQTALALS